MLFRPIDEMSLRHLFSTPFAKEILGLSYVGPVLDHFGKVDTSPDALILDMRKSPYKVLRCEFKFSPNGKEDFSHNGKFDVAVIWSYGKVEKEKLKADLLDQNGCYEVVALEESKEFHSLLEYNNENIKSSQDFTSLKATILKRDPAYVTCLYMAAAVYPKRIDYEGMIEYLSRRFPQVASMGAKGKSNAVTAFTQTTPPLMEWVYAKNYSWVIDFDSKVGKAYLAELLQLNFRIDLPTDKDLELVTGK
jgi:hypothetical protein